MLWAKNKHLFSRRKTSRATLETFKKPAENKMNINNLRPLQKETQFRGIGVSLSHLFTSISKLNNNHSYVFFVERSLPVPKIVNLFASSEVIELRPIDFCTYRFVRAFVTKNRVIDTTKDVVNVLFEADGELGTPKGVPSVLVFHDIIPMLFRDDDIINQTTGVRKIKRQIHLSFIRKKYGWFLSQYVGASHILAISKNSLADLGPYLPNLEKFPLLLFTMGVCSLKKGERNVHPL